jgi:hypothetical protein
MTHHVVTLIGGSSSIKFALFEAAAGLGGHQAQNAAGPLWGKNGPK